MHAYFGVQGYVENCLLVNLHKIFVCQYFPNKVQQIIPLTMADNGFRLLNNLTVT